MRFVLAAACFTALAVPPTLASNPDSLKPVQQLIKQGKFEEALKHIQTLRDKLPANAKLAKWTIDLRQVKGYPCDGLLIGKKHLYFIVRYSRRSQAPLGVPDARPLLNDTGSIYDFNTMITCVSGATGKKLWSRHVAGGVNLALDPSSDDVLCWRRSLIRLRAAKGDVIFSKEMPAKKGRVRAVVVDGHIHVDRRDKLVDDSRGGPIPTYNAATGAVALTDVVRPFRLAPDERKILELDLSLSPSKVVTRITARRLNGAPMWTYEYPGYVFNEPFWHKDDVIALNGPQNGHGEVVRLDGQTGEVRWRHALPGGPYVAASDQLLGNNYQDPWSASGIAGEWLLTIGARGTLYFLDPTDGKVRARMTPLTTYLAFPRVIDGAIIVGSQFEIRAIPLDTIFDRCAVSEKHLLFLEATCRQGLGEPKKALELLDPLLEQVPEYPEAWLLRAKLCKELQLPLAEITSRCKYLALTNRELSSELRRRWGLIKRLPLGCHDKNRLMTVAGQSSTRGGLASTDIIYIGTANGVLHAIDGRSLDIIESKHYPAAILTIFKDTELFATFGDRGKGAIEKVSLAPANAPPEWYNVAGRDGKAVSWKGKYFRPHKGGHVSVLEGNKMRKFKTALKGIESWEIHISPFGPVGYGAGGVYRLDQNLCPARKLIDAGVSNGSGRPRLVAHVADNAQTICIFVAEYSRKVLQIWTRDGKKMLREVDVGEPRRQTPSTRTLTAVGEGYLYTGIDLVWLSPAPEKAPWRFSASAAMKHKVSTAHNRHVSPFGPPLLHNNFLLVTCRDGGVYVFHLATVTK